MKVGDLIRFKKEHWDRPGFTYCGNWIGLIWRKTGPIFEIYWTTPIHGNFIGDYITSKDNSWELISESG